MADESIINCIASILTEDPSVFLEGPNSSDNFFKLYNLAHELGAVQKYALKLYISDHPSDADVLVQRVKNAEDLNRYIEYWASQGLIPSLDSIQNYLSQKQGAQTNRGGINNRQAMMLRFVNLTQRANLPITADSYNQIGRSAGYLKFVTENDIAWNAFISSKEFMSLLENMNDDSRKKLATEIILYVNRQG